MSDFQNERRLRRQRSTEASPPSVEGPAPPPPLPSDVGGAGSLWKPLDVETTERLLGIPVVVRSANGDTAEAVYKATRKMDYQRRCWVPHRVWGLRNASGSYVPFEPVEYAMLP